MTVRKFFPIKHIPYYRKLNILTCVLLRLLCFFNGALVLQITVKLLIYKVDMHINVQFQTISLTTVIDFAFSFSMSPKNASYQYIVGEHTVWYYMYYILCMVGSGLTTITTCGVHDINM